MDIPTPNSHLPSPPDAFGGEHSTPARGSRATHIGVVLCCAAAALIIAVGGVAFALSQNLGLSALVMAAVAFGGAGFVLPYLPNVPGMRVARRFAASAAWVALLAIAYLFIWKR